MDPFGAFSFAGTILAFSRFGIALLKEGRELYKSTHGVLTANEELELVITDLRALLVKLRRKVPAATSTNISALSETKAGTLPQIISDAEKIANELLKRLDGLKIENGKDRKWESVRKAVESVWTKDEITALTKRLGSFKDAVETNILVAIIDSLDVEAIRNSSRFDRLDQRTQLIISSLLENSIWAKKSVEATGEVRDQLDTLIELVRRVDTIPTTDHLHARAEIAKYKVGELRSQSEGGVTEILARFEMLNVSDEQESRLRTKLQDEILQSLAYSSMTERYEDIFDAYPETFEWAFKNTTADQLPWHNFADWLKTGSGVYWISGKAGSGKSTLLKHIYDDARTRTYLRLWANKDVRQGARASPLCLATFFFWNSGTPEQKSQSGLLRALLYQVLSSYPEVIPAILPDLWAKGYSLAIKGRSNSHTSLGNAWTLRRLSQTLLKLVRQQSVRLNLCFLVDGLDELDGDHEEMAGLLRQAAESSNVKICLSSRPWVIFQETYHSCPSLRLQDLTFPDIEHYVFSKFQRNPAFRRLELDKPDSAALLRNEVVEKAEGVFLWVKIVVNSLLMGIRNQDSIEILRQRLHLMPPELEPLYRHLMSLIDQVYLAWASKAFRIVRAVREFCSDDLAGIAHREEGKTALPIVQLFLAIADDLNFVIDTWGNVSVVQRNSATTSQQLTVETLQLQCEKMRIHLTARCAGLLEVPRFEQKGMYSAVQFLHRTARDFLELDGNWEKMTRHATNETFDPRSAMLKASVFDLAIKTSENIAGPVKTLDIVREAMLWAYYLDIEGSTNDGDVAVLDVLEQTMTQRSAGSKSRKKAQRDHWSHRIVGSFQLGPDTGMLGFATLYGLSSYVRKKLQGKREEDIPDFTLSFIGQAHKPNENLPHEEKELDSNLASKLLHVLLISKDFPLDLSLPWERPEMVATLLSLGANPNYVMQVPPYESTPWLNMLRLCVKQKVLETASARMTSSFVRNMQQLVAAGASTDVTGDSVKILQPSFKTVEEMVKEIIMPRFPGEGVQLLKMLTLQKNKQVLDGQTIHSARESVLPNPDIKIERETTSTTENGVETFGQSEPALHRAAISHGIQGPKLLKTEPSKEPKKRKRRIMIIHSDSDYEE